MQAKDKSFFSCVSPKLSTTFRSIFLASLKNQKKELAELKINHKNYGEFKHTNEV